MDFKAFQLHFLDYLDHVQNVYANTKAERQKVTFTNGPKYVKVIVDGSVHSFVIKQDDSKFRQGDILKAASWAAPARNFARGNIMDGCWRHITWTGA